MVQRFRVSPLLRILPLILVLTFAIAPPARGQEAPTRWAPLGGPGGRLTQLAAAPDGRTLYAVSVTGVNRESDQTQWRDRGTAARSDALYISRDAGATWAAPDE